MGQRFRRGIARGFETRTPVHSSRLFPPRKRRPCWFASLAMDRGRGGRQGGQPAASHPRRGTRRTGQEWDRPGRRGTGKGGEGQAGKAREWDRQVSRGIGWQGVWDIVWGWSVMSHPPPRAHHTRALFDALYDRLVLRRQGAGVYFESCLGDTSKPSTDETWAHRSHLGASNPPGATPTPRTTSGVETSAELDTHAKHGARVDEEVTNFETKQPPTIRRVRTWNPRVAPNDRNEGTKSRRKRIKDEKEPILPRPGADEDETSPKPVREEHEGSGARRDCCSICYQPFRRGVKWTKLPTCGHRFHVPCIQKWVEVQNTCPTCRVRVTKLRNRAVPDRSLAALLPNAAYEALVCTACGSGADEGRLLLCDGCDRGWHIYCLVPPKSQLPSEEEAWFCDSCTRLQAATSTGTTRVPQHQQAVPSTAPQEEAARLTHSLRGRRSTNRGRRSQPGNRGRGRGRRGRPRAGVLELPVPGVLSEDPDLKVS